METRSRTKVRLANAKSDPILARTRAYNSTTLIARLPNEVLSRIFLLHKVAVIKAYRARQQYEDCHTFTAVPWISPTHVCTLWRSIAPECTAFWNTLLLGNPVPIPERIRRSKQGLLDISGYHTDVASAIVAKCLYILRSWGWEMVVPSILAALEGAMFPAIRQVTIHGVEKTEFSDGIHDSCPDVLLRLIRQPMIGLRPPDGKLSGRLLATFPSRDTQKAN
ncbi:hypothetical protein DL96DRAFT_648165 [Flagelloscypha sp. PMI_526]|nr:hypothetical protein DL96DRAFT_648165 [Flagelloscypha sp. PMI_526]